MAPYFDFIQPYIMDWTVMPAKVAAKAWIDPEFRRALLSEPAEQIRSMMRKSSLPEGVTFYVHENTESIRHFPLPAVQASMADLPREDLKRKVEQETGEETSLDYVLPAPVIFRSLVDPEYRNRLLTDADATLRADGYALDGFGVQVHENTAAVHHLALPVNIWKDEKLDYAALVQKSVNRIVGEAE